MEPLTTIAPPTRDSASSLLVGVGIIVIAIISMVGNSFVIFVNFTDPDLQANVSNLLIINLAITDLLNAIIVMTPSVIAILEDGWILGGVFCNIHCIFNYCLISVSMLTLAMISVDRGIAVRYPLHYAQRVTKKWIVAVMGYTWIHGTIVSVIPSACRWVVYDYWEVVCTLSWDDSSGIMVYVLVSFIVSFLMPGIVIMVINLWIICFSQSLHKKSITPVMRSVDSESQIAMSETTSSMCVVPSTNPVSSQHFHHKKIVQSMFIVTVFFFICMTPFNLGKLIKVLGTEQTLPPWMNVLSTVSQFFASAGNPFLYAIFRNDYRQAFKRFLRRFRIRIAQFCELD